MQSINTVIIGGGQAGLAMSYCLQDFGVENIVLERGKIGQRWRDRWDSLRLATPNWQSRLPGWRYRGLEPSGYMNKHALVHYLEGYADSFAASIEEETLVEAVCTQGEGYEVRTNRGRYHCANVVIATGACDQARIPGFASNLSSGIEQVYSNTYRRPEHLPEGGVLVVGAASTGIRLADELQRAGRDVVLSVGTHSRMPRSYRGRDIMDWLDVLGELDQRIEDVSDQKLARSLPSLQLSGSPESQELDLGVLQGRGVKLVGRTLGMDGERVFFASDLSASIARSESALDAMLGRIDHYIEEHRLSEAVPPATRLPAIDVGQSAEGLSLQERGISTVLWATGFRRTYPWLELPITDAEGELVHEGGVTPAPGVYALGLDFMRRRRSTFLGGVGNDAYELASHLVGSTAKR
jgi:putative flavoprotein involved in K+ transport